jgi:hypothetical protein
MIGRLELDCSEVRVHVGVMMSRKTLKGIPSKYTHAFPHRDEVAGIFNPHPWLFNVLHYADYEGIDVLACLLEAADYGGPNMDAMQLDMIWPDPAVLRVVCRDYPRIKFILQVNSESLNAVANDPVLLVHKLREYDDMLSHILLDKSMGKGVGMDAQALLPFVREVHTQLPQIQIAAAGGLGPDTLHLIEPIINEFPGVISCDAQGKLRSSGDARDPIEWAKADWYVAQGHPMLMKK